MFATRRDVLVFLGKVLLALPLTLALWFFSTPFLNLLAAQVAKVPIAVASGARVGGITMHDSRARYDVTVFPEYQMGRARPPATTDIDVNPSIYTFGMALFLALSLAAKPARRFWPIVIGVAVLLFVPAWGVAFDALKQLAVAPDLVSYLGFSTFKRESIVLGYQLGVLLLPTLVPIALWFGLNARAILARTA